MVLQKKHCQSTATLLFQIHLFCAFSASYMSNGKIGVKHSSNFSVQLFVDKGESFCQIFVNG